MHYYPTVSGEGPSQRRITRLWQEISLLGMVADSGKAGWDTKILREKRPQLPVTSRSIPMR
jgi:hypothetical protein